jgi:hypothetical protein
MGQPRLMTVILPQGLSIKQFLWFAVLMKARKDIYYVGINNVKQRVRKAVEISAPDIGFDTGIKLWILFDEVKTRSSLFWERKQLGFELCECYAKLIGVGSVVCQPDTKFFALFFRGLIQK